MSELKTSIHGSVYHVWTGRANNLGIDTRSGGLTLGERAGFVLAAGINNEYATASLAVLDPEASFAVSPQSSGSGFQCDCSGSPPPYYFLFPRTELNRLSVLPYNRGGISSAVGPRLMISTVEWPPRAAALYELNEQFNVERVDMFDGFWDVHRELESQGHILHSVENCPERTEPKHIRVFEPGRGWRDTMAPVGGKPVPGA
ncbi:MAG: hypothetical protein HY646_04870 [Acidobacteria bacterium]|nr:hypothetical protein [Acidobacteriota bacterium]